uniref:Ig-like domain-containing protein n=1 Tax=Anabas testudineus TaxID=64144 RepID=A0A3Q1IIV5_ANATE
MLMYSHDRLYIFFSALIHPTEVRQQIAFVVAEIGGNVTLRCPMSEKGGNFFHWYKQSPGYMIQTVAARTYNEQKLYGEFNNPRFTVTESESQYFLTIRNVTKEDEATYSCQTGTAYSQTFANSTYLAVNEQNQQKSVHVKRCPQTDSVQPGDIVNLQCSLLFNDKENKVQFGEHNVYWFRPGSGGSHPSLIYTHRNRSNEEEERSCVYSLSKTIQNSSNTGTYYCAVVTCGEIFFGEGTNVKTIVIVLGVLLACCATVTAALTFCVIRMSVCEHCKEALIHYYFQDGDAETANYATLDFNTKKVKKGKRKRESPEECVYSAVRLSG